MITVARLKDIVYGLNQQTSRKSAELTRDFEELNKLRASWQRYIEVSKRIESNERAANIGRALLHNAPVEVKVNPRRDTYADPQYTRGMQGKVEEVADFDLTKVSLWRVIREIVRQTTEIRVCELEAYLKTFGVKRVSRPAIESALITHPKEFKLTKRGREKFVCLK